MVFEIEKSINGGMSKYSHNGWKVLLIKNVF